MYKAYKNGNYLKLFGDIFDYGSELADRTTNANETAVPGPRQLTPEEKNAYAWMVIISQCNWILGRAMNIAQYVADLVDGMFNPLETTMSEKLFPKEVVEGMVDKMNALLFPHKKVGIFKEDLFKHTVPCVRFVSVEETRIRCSFKTVPFNEPIKRLEWNEYVEGIREEFQEENEKLEKEVEELEEEIKDNDKAIAANQAEIQSNDKAIAANQAEIQSNDKAIAANQFEIKSNDKDIGNNKAEADANQHMVGSSLGLMGVYGLVAFLLNHFRPELPGPLQVMAKVFTGAVGQAVTGGESGPIKIDMEDIEKAIGNYIPNLEGKLEFLHQEVCEVRRKVRA